MSLTNLQLAELLVRAGEGLEQYRARAYRRAARAALGWPEEAADVLASGRPLTELYGLGPKLAGRVRAWLEDPPEVPDPPSNRRGFQTLAWAERRLEESPEWRGALRGDLQMHTSYSDGHLSVFEMACVGARLGHDYLAITDHSKGLKIAGGIDEAMLAHQAKEIDDANDRLADAGIEVRVLKSIELNMGLNGEADMEPDALERLDVVLGSFHSKLRATEDQTHRYLAALRNPSLDILGHPRTRMFNNRIGLNADWPRVFETAAELGKAVEIDCHPNRQDLDLDTLRLAAAAGCHISIGTDAHAAFELEPIHLGLAYALEAGVDRSRILNFMPADHLLSWSKARR